MKLPLLGIALGANLVLANPVRQPPKTLEHVTPGTNNTERISSQDGTRRNDALVQKLNSVVNFDTPPLARRREFQVDNNHNLCDGPLVTRGGIVEGETCISLTNATPYRWKRGYLHKHQLQNWEKWPEYIEPGQTFSNRARQNQGFYRAHTAAEVVYHLQGTKRPASFMLEYREGKEHRVWVSFHENLKTANLPTGSEIDLGMRRFPDGEGFVLAGTEGDFISNDGPEAWMQSLLGDIGDMPLSEIVMGRSHHAGSDIATLLNWGEDFNAQTQTESLYKQLRDGGARVLDIRTMRRAYESGDNMEFYECHGTNVLGIQAWSGLVGASYGEMIQDVNDFNNDYPGELIIFDIHGSDAWSEQAVHMGHGGGFEHTWPKMNASDRADLYAALGGLKHRISLPDRSDYTKLPVKHFIGEGKPAVLIRVDQSWVDADGAASFPGASQGFVTTKNFPVTSRWSGMDRARDMVEDQLTSLRKHRLRPTTATATAAQTAPQTAPRPVYDMQWIMTLKGVANILNVNSIVSLAREELWGRMFRDLWGALTVDQYPSWLTVDAIWGSEFKSLVTAMNKCFVARRCGNWANEERRRQLAHS